MLKRILLILTAALFSSAAVLCNGENTPKNVIFLIGDGMGNAYVSASVHSDKNAQFRNFSTVGLVVTCSADKLITDSAASGTALSSGTRTYNGAIGVDMQKKNLKSVLEFAEENGYSTGLISTSSITHATPAAFYGHVTSRGEQDSIAVQMVASGVDVAIGAGRDFFLPKGNGGKREDGKNVVDELKKKGYEYFDTFEALKNYSGDAPLLGLLADKSIEKATARDYNLGQLTSIAIDKLSKKDKGFFLMIEGSQIDWAGHANMQDYAEGELKDFNTAIKAALDFAKKDGNTLVVVTADHETGGMAIYSGNKDGSDLEFKFASKGHTPEMVPVFSTGPGENNFRGIMENYQIGETLINFFNK